MWLIAILGYMYLPETIPIHFDFKGNVDGYGPKAVIFILPAIGSLISLMIVLISDLPSDARLLKKFTASNSEFQKTMMKKWMHAIILSIVILFILLELSSIYTAVKGRSSILSGIAPLMLVFFIGQNIYFLYQFSKPDKEMKL